MVHSLAVSKKEVRDILLEKKIHLKLIKMTTENLKKIKIEKAFTENFVYIYIFFIFF